MQYLFPREIFNSNTKTNLLGVLYTRTIVHEASSSPSELTVMFTKTYRSPETWDIFIKWLISLLFDVGPFSLLATLENQFSTKPVAGIHLLKDILSLCLIASVSVHYLEH